MPSSRTHISVGVFTGLALISSTSTAKINLNINLSEFIPAVIIGSIIPDIDTAKSWVSQTVPFVDDRLRKIGVLKHRGFTHGLTGIIMAMLLFVIFRTNLTLGLSLGYISHCLTDEIFTMLRIDIDEKIDKLLYNIFWIVNVLLIVYLIYERWFM